MADTLEIVQWKSDGLWRVLEQRPEQTVRVHGRYRNRGLAERRLSQIRASRMPRNPNRNRGGGGGPTAGASTTA